MENRWNCSWNGYGEGHQFRTGDSLSGLTVFNGALYFKADDGSTGSELWKTDGTAAGTVMVKDINSGAGDSYPSYLTVFNGALYFRR